MIAASNPRARSYWELSRYLATMIDAAGIMLDPDAPARRREQARRRFDRLHVEASRRWPGMFDRKGL